MDSTESREAMDQREVGTGSTIGAR
jgi:hypothetical protein